MMTKEKAIELLDSKGEVACRAEAYAPVRGHDRRKIRKWIAALRSGEYKQGKKSLAITTARGTTSYCCLGVYCEVVAKLDPGQFDLCSFPSEVGVTLPIGLDAQSVLAAVNDNGFSFKKIANIVEAVWLA